MKIGLSTSLHLDHGRLSLDQRSGDQPSMQAFVPIGLLSLKAVLDRTVQDIDTRVIELNGMINEGRIRNDEDFYDHIVDAILRDGDDLAGFMTDADSLPHTILTARRVKERSPQTRICIGGPASSSISGLLVERFPFIDYVVRGEGDQTFAELLIALQQGRELDHVAGITWRKAGVAVLNADRPVIENLDELPFPAFEAFHMSPDAALYLDVGRGCPFRCRFCATAPFWSRKYRMKSTTRILQEMTLLRDRYHRTHINFSHDIFTCDRKWTLAFCDRLIQENLGVEWTCSTRTDIIDEQTLERMAAAGCVEIYYGIEAGSPSTQIQIDKGLDLSRSREVLRATVKAGIRPITGFIVGHPTETSKSLEETLDTFFEFLEIGKVRSHLFTLCPFQEAPMYRLYENTLSRSAQCADIALMNAPAKDFSDIRNFNRDIFASALRYATPTLDEGLVDASEELSCHLVILKSLWPVLLPQYRSTLDWYTRWVDWIKAHNARYRPDTVLKHQGNAWDLLQFAREDLSRLGLESSDLADLVRYEEAKLDARGLSDPTRNKTIISQLEPQTVVGTRCSYVTKSFRYDLQSLLDGRRTEAALDGEFWIIFAKTSQNFVETIQTRRPGRKLLDLAWDPHTVAELVDKLKSEEDLDDERSVRLIRQLCDRGVLGIRQMSSIGTRQKADCGDRKGKLLLNIQCEHRMLMAHPVYTSIRSLDELCIFMEYHAFAVWDFMSLLKALQRALSCVNIPWIPSGNPNTRRLINDIVMTEESDEDGLGGFASHFELYLNAMRQAGADTGSIDDFIARIRRREDVVHALDCCAAPPGASRFVNTTFNVIRSGELHRIAACFTFGREDIIPEMFRNIVEEIRKHNSAHIEQFIYYLDRHIEVDTDKHGPMALEMVTVLCGDSAIKWREAEETAVSAMRSRVQFWDSVVEMIYQHRAIQAANCRVKLGSPIGMMRFSPGPGPHIGVAPPRPVQLSFRLAREPVQPVSHAPGKWSANDGNGKDKCSDEMAER